MATYPSHFRVKSLLNAFGLALGAGLLFLGCSSDDSSGAVASGDPCAMAASGQIPAGPCSPEGKSCGFSDGFCSTTVVCKAGSWFVDTRCEGEPVPVPSNCSDLWDGNASSEKFWLLGASGYIKGTAISANPNGHIVSAGVLLGQEFRLGTAFTNTPNAFVFRENPSGDEFILINQSPAGSSYPMHINATYDGGFVLSGIFTGTLDTWVDSFSVPDGHGGIFVTSVDSSNVPLWSRAFDGGFTGYPGGVAADPKTGNTTFAATFETTADLGGGPISSSGGEDILLVQLDPTGQVLWQKAFGGMGDTTEWVRDIALDSSGNIFLTGLYTSDLNFGGGALPNAGAAARAYVAKLTPQGQHLWSMSCTSTAKTQGGSHIAVDASGNVAVSGWFDGDIACGGLQLSGLSSDNPFLLLLDANGKPAHLELISLGGAYQEGPDVAFDIQGNVLLAGKLASKLEFSGSDLQSAGNSDAFFAKLSPNGQFLSGLRTGDQQTQGALAVTAINDGNAAITGFTRGFFCPNKDAFPESTGLGNDQAFILEMLP